VNLFNNTPLTLGVSGGLSLLLASSGASAISTGPDLNLSTKMRAGGMAGAAYTIPQEASAAVFGNPATLTQFKGVNLNFGASFLLLTDIDNHQTSTIEGSTVFGGALNGSHSNTSSSDASNYILPDFGVTLQISPNLVIGTGLEVDAGIGADWRDSPITLLGGAAGTGLPLTAEAISFSSNLAAAYQVNERLSVGGSITIGFGLMQLGTAGPTTGLDNFNSLLNTAIAPASVGTAFTDFGGTTSSVHDIGFGASAGLTYLIQDGVMFSATIKSPVEYNFRNVLYADIIAVPDVENQASDGFQNLSLQSPTELIFGIALNDVLMPGLLLEVDAVWKNWSDAHTFEDGYEDQWLINFGAQYKHGDFTYRAGYSYAQDIFSDQPSGTLGGLEGIGTIDLDAGEQNPLATDIVKIVQNTLISIPFNHTVTAGLSYQISDALSVDGYMAYAYGETASEHLNTLAATAALALDASSVTIKNQIDIGYEMTMGIGLNLALP